jgi:hypothetical protein
MSAAALAPMAASVSQAVSVATLVKIGMVGGVLRYVPPPAPKEPSNELLKAWFKISTPLRFFISGNLGNLCFFYLEHMISNGLGYVAELPNFIEGIGKDGISFFIAYSLQIVTQHFLHASLVYGLHSINTGERYFKSLAGESASYVFALFGSTFLNLFLLRVGLNKTVAFITTMTVFAVINYFLIGSVVRWSMESSSKTGKSTTQRSVMTKLFEVMPVEFPKFNVPFITSSKDGAETASAAATSHAVGLSLLGTYV